MSAIIAHTATAWGQFVMIPSKVRHALTASDVSLNPSTSWIKLIQGEVCILRRSSCNLRFQVCVHLLLQKIPVETSVNNGNVLHVHQERGIELYKALLRLKTSNLHDMGRHSGLVFCPQTLGFDTLWADYPPFVTTSANR